MAALLLQPFLQSCGGDGGGGGGGGTGSAPAARLTPTSGRVSADSAVAAACTGGGAVAVHCANAERQRGLAGRRRHLGTDAAAAAALRRGDHGQCGRLRTRHRPLGRMLSGSDLNNRNDACLLPVTPGTASAAVASTVAVPVQTLREAEFQARRNAFAPGAL